MSSTGRGVVRQPDDMYVTPNWCIDEFLKRWTNVDAGAYRAIVGWNVLDPCAGGIGDDPDTMPYVKALNEYPGNLRRLTSVDIREDSPAEFHEDFLDMAFDGNEFDLIISNPPYSLAQQFIDKALSLLAPSGYVAFLLRLNFFESQKRNAWWQKNKPKCAFVHSRRPKFIPNHFRKYKCCNERHCGWKGWVNPKEVYKCPDCGNLAMWKGKKPPGSDSSAYAHFLWQKGYTGPTMLDVIPMEVV